MSDITIEVRGGVVEAVYGKGSLDVMVIDYDNLNAGGTVDLYNTVPMDKNYENMIKNLRKYGITPDDLL